MHGLRYEYQDRVNFVILDFDIAEDVALARDLRVGQHPAFAVVAADGVMAEDVTERRFGPQTEANLRALLDGLAR